MIKFIYFDLADVCYTYPHSYRGLAVQFGRTEEQFRGVFVKYGKMCTKGLMTLDELWQAMRRELNIKGGADFEFTKYWVDQYVPRLEMHRFIIDISKTYPVGLLMNNFIGLRKEIFNRGLVPDVQYKAVIFSDEVKYRKPEPEIYKLAENKAGYTQSEILFIDDRMDFIEGAKKAGWITVRFDVDNPEKSMKEVKKLLGNL